MENHNEGFELPNSVQEGNVQSGCKASAALECLDSQTKSPTFSEWLDAELVLMEKRLLVARPPMPEMFLPRGGASTIR